MPTHDPNHIWLSPSCDDNSLEGRQWCSVNQWPDNCGDTECNSEPTKYIRADIYEALQVKLDAEIAERTKWKNRAIEYSFSVWPDTTGR